MVFLSQAGYVVEHVDDGEKAWARISADVAWFDVLITDTQMPRMNGLTLVHRVLAAGFTGQIIVNTPGLEAGQKELFQNCGVETFIPKLSSLEVMLAAIARHSRGKNTPTS